MPAVWGVLRGAPGKTSRASRGGRRSRQRAVADGRARGGPHDPRSVSRRREGGGGGGGGGAGPPLPGPPLGDDGNGARPHWGRAVPNASLYSARRPAPGPLRLFMRLSSLRLPLAGLVLLLAGLLLAATPSPEPDKPPSGFTPSTWNWQKAFEAKLQERASASFCRDHLRFLTSQPHLRSEERR